MTPPQVALRQIPSQGGLIRLHPGTGWEVEPRPGETPEEAAYRGAADAATAILAAYDSGTAKHSDDVLTVCEAIADRLNVIGSEKKHLTAVAQLHDIGKIMVSSEILNKPGPLDDDEWETMRRHTIEGEQILASVPEISEVAHLVRSCHERYDGQGYPDGLAGEQIPLVARIVFCADAFHAMRCDRPYRVGRPVTAALAEIRANAGTQFDPVVVAALCDVHKSLATQRKHGLGILRSGARSRRLVALLATLTVSGSAMAATGAYKDLPLVHDGESRGVPTVTHAPAGAVKSPILGVENPSVRVERQDAGSGADASPRAGSRGFSSAGTPPASDSPRSGGAPEPRGVAHGVHGTAPGQAVPNPKKVKPPKAKRPKWDRPKPKGPRVELPKVTVPKVDVPKVDVPRVNVPMVKVPTLTARVKAPKVPR